MKTPFDVEHCKRAMCEGSSSNDVIMMQLLCVGDEI